MIDNHNRDEIQKLYIRMCQDSLYRLNYIDAAILVGKMLKISPIEVWCAFGGLEVMERVAKGEFKDAKVAS